MPCMWPSERLLLFFSPAQELGPGRPGLQQHSRHAKLCALHPVLKRLTQDMAPLVCMRHPNQLLLPLCSAPVLSRYSSKCSGALQEARDKMRAACRLAAEILQMAGKLVKVRFLALACQFLSLRLVYHADVAPLSRRIAVLLITAIVYIGRLS